MSPTTYRITRDGASWYERTETGPVPASFLAAVDTIADLVAHEAAAAGVPTERCVVGGFSQGGFLALATRHSRRCTARCPRSTACSSIHRPGSAPRRWSRVGERDEIITPDRGRAAAAQLAATGWRVTDRGYDMAHSQRIEMMVDAREWLAAIS